MKTLIINIGCVIVFVSGIILSQQETNKIRIGTFDSRCVALAYGRSAEFMKLRDSVETVYLKAQIDSNKEVIKEIEQFKPTMQVLLHQQVFSNASINNILDKIKDKLPELAKENNLKMIISKWEISFADETFEYIDITDQLIKLFSPDEQTKKIIDNMKTIEPIPIEKISTNPMD